MKRLLPFTSGFGLFLIFMPLAIEWRGLWAWLPIAVVFMIVPILDTLGGLSLWNPDAEAEGELSADRRFRAIVCLWVPVAVGFTAWALVVASAPGVTWLDRIGLALSIGFMNGVIGITYAHELIHQPSRFEQLCGETLLVLVSYLHWRIEHVFGHHRWVATPRDPASSRLGEPIYTFYFRSVYGSLVSAWHLECDRLARVGARKFGPKNRMLWYALITAGLYGLICAVTGPLGALFFLVQGIVGFSSLEVINYVEHYGLQRREISPGRYETTRPQHSWNAGQRISNAMLINLARHSDHHAIASRPYQILRTFDADSAPQLPQGYATMFLVALVPPLWFRVMDPLVAEWNARKGVAA
jgi:alkane 1-monooxygenase